jgi:hypothetical protein
MGKEAVVKVVYIVVLVVRYTIILIRNRSLCCICIEYNVLGREYEQ